MPDSSQRRPDRTLIERGVRLFDAGLYWEAHEAWEEAWIPDRRGPDAPFLKGIIQVAAGCLHYTRHNRRGAVNKWAGGAAYLRPYAPAHLGIEVSPLLERVDGFLEAMRSSPHSWPDLLMPRLRPVSRPSGQE